MTRGDACFYTTNTRVAKYSLFDMLTPSEMPDPPMSRLNASTHSQLGCRTRGHDRSSWKVLVIERDKEYEDPMANITYPDVDRLTFWGVPYQFDYVFGPGTKQAQARLAQPMPTSARPRA